MKKSILLFMIAIILAGCGRPAQTPDPAALTATAAALVTPTPEPSPTPSPTATPSGPVMPTPPQNRTHYKLDLILNYYTQLGNVTETITYTNRADKALEEILLIIPPRDYAGSYEQFSLTGERVAGFSEDGTKTYVQLSQPLQPGEMTHIGLNFRLYFPAHEGIFGATNRQTNIADWYPFVPPYDNQQGWLAYQRQVDNTNTIVGEYLVNELADFDVSLQLTDHADLIEVAASAPASGTDGKYSYHLELARAFSFSVSDSFFEHEIIQDGVRIHSYVFMNQQETGEAVLQIAAQAMKLFGELFAPYPREMISIVAADFLHNMEMDGMVLLSHKVFDFYDNTPRNNLTILVPHELSHQWFYSLIGNNQAMEPWLDESLATYCEVLYFERYHPDEVVWWWTNRVDEYGPNGYVNSTIYNPGIYTEYRNAVYLNGARFLQDLRVAIGEQAFYASLKDYAVSNFYQIATRADFFAAFSRHTQVDLEPVIQRYFSN